MMRSLAVFFLLAVFSQDAAAKPKPISSFFNVCRRNQSSEQLSECLKNTLEKARPRLIKGIPELKLLPMDPMHIDKMEMKENSGRFKFSQILSNLTIYGLGDYVVKDISLDFDKLVLNITTWTPKTRFEGSYEMDGKIMVVPIKGSGHASYNFTEVISASSAQFKTVKKNNKIYLKIDSYKMSIDPKEAHSHFTNLFNGDKRLGEATNAFLNENWKDAYNTYRELPERAFAQFLASQAGKVFSLYTLDELFPQ